MHRYDHDIDDGLRPKAGRVEQEDSNDRVYRAVVAGRVDALGPHALIGLQRTVGNAGVTGLVEDERSTMSEVVDTGGGSPLDAGTRADMEARFRHDFGDVRVHTGAAANESARSMAARAYTVGSNIVLRDSYDPSSSQDRHTLAHELTHVVQQRRGPVDGTDIGRGIRVSDPSDRFEQEAATTADRLTSQSAPAGPADATLQRQEEPETEEGTELATAQTYVQREGAEEGEEEESA